MELILQKCMQYMASGPYSLYSPWIRGRRAPGMRDFVALGEKR
jgi:hypothetical protein